MFADRLAESIETLGRPVIRLDSDGFHHVRAIRYRQGSESARGYYEDAYDFDSLRDLALLPLGANGPHRYTSRVHDLATDEVVREWAMAPVDAVVLFDATFLQRDDLRDHWDEVIYLDATMERAQAAGTARDARSSRWTRARCRGIRGTVHGGVQDLRSRAEPARASLDRDRSRRPEASATGPRLTTVRSLARNPPSIAPSGLRMDPESRKGIPIRYRADFSPMYALWAPKGGDHLAGGWIDDWHPVDDDGRYRLVAVSHRPDIGGCVGVRPDVDSLYQEMMPPQDKAHSEAIHAAWSPVQRHPLIGPGCLGGTVHGISQSRLCGTS